MRLTVASASDPLGFDTLVGPLDLDPTGRSATGLELFEAAIFHRITTDKISLIDSPSPDEMVDFGVRVQDWIGEPVGDLSNKGSALDAVLQRDPRTASTRCDVVRAPRGSTFDSGEAVELLVYITARTVTGQSVDRIVGVGAVTVAFLAQGT